MDLPPEYDSPEQAALRAELTRRFPGLVPALLRHKRKQDAANQATQQPASQAAAS